jgi:hypothetical protein
MSVIAVWLDSHGGWNTTLDEGLLEETRDHVEWHGEVLGVSGSEEEALEIAGNVAEEQGHTWVNDRGGHSWVPLPIFGYDIDGQTSPTNESAHDY